MTTTPRSPTTGTEAPLAVLGYGPMGRALATRLAAGAEPYLVAARQGPSRDRAAADGHPVAEPDDALGRAAGVAVALPDRVAAAWPFADPGEGRSLVFLNGWALEAGSPPPGPDLLMVAPKAIADRVAAGPFTAAVAVAADRSGRADASLSRWQEALQVKRAITATPREELVADLYSEQMLLCGWGPEAALCCHTALVEAGIPPALAWEECVAEAAHVFSVLAAKGPEGFADAVSEAALVGGAAAARRFPAAEFERVSKDVLAAIENGEFVARRTTAEDPAADRAKARRHWEGRGVRPEAEA